MKKYRLLVVVTVLLALMTFAFCACDNSDNKPGETPDIQLDYGASSITFSAGSAYDFEYSVDGGARKSGTSVSYAKSEGEHSVTVYLISDGKDVKEKTFTYTSVKVSLTSISVEGETASWTAVGKTVSLKVGNGDYEPTTASSYTATETVTVKVKAEGGWDADANKYYYGTAVERSATIDLSNSEKLSAPVITAGNTGITWAAVENATGYMIKVDTDERSGSYADATEMSYAYATVVTNYVVSVKAVGDGENYTDSDAAVFRYAVKNTAVKIKKENAEPMKATVSCEGTVLQKKVNGEFVNIDSGSVITATESCTVDLKAIGGWDADAKVFYVGESEDTVYFTAPATEAAVIETATGKEDGDLQDSWTISKYDNNSSSWTACSASIHVAEKYDGSECVNFECWNNTTRFRYTFNYADFALADGYNAIRFDYKGDDVSKMYLRLEDSVSGIYATIDLGVMAGSWQTYTVALSDSRWKLAFNGSEYALDMALNIPENTEPYVVPSRIKNFCKLYELISYCDKISFIVTGNTPNGVNAHLYLDELQFVYEENCTTGAVQPLFDLASNFVCEMTDISGNVYAAYLDIDYNASMANFYTRGLTQNINFDLDVEKDLDAGTITVKNNDVTLNCKFEANGAAVAVVSTRGAAAQAFEGAKFITCANVLLDFEEVTSNVPYVNAAWTQTTYKTSGWQATSGQMNSREKDGSRVVNFAVGSGTTNKFVYNQNGKKLGLTNYVSLYVGNYFAGATDYQWKFALTDVKGNAVYLAGDKDNFALYPVTTGLEFVEFKLEKAVDVQNFYVVGKSNSGNAYLYVDNIVLAYKVEGDEPAGKQYAAPTITASEDDGITLTHEDGSAVLEYSLNAGEWTVGSSVRVSDLSEGKYTLEARVKTTGNDTAITASYDFEIVAVTLSDIAVDGTKSVVASWTTNGKVSVKLGTGNYRAHAKNNYTFNQSSDFAVKAEGYFDDVNNIYYVGTVEKSKRVIVPVNLAAPELTLGQGELTWAAVANADGYAVSVNEGEYVPQTQLSFAYPTDGTDFVISVKATSTNAEQYPDGNVASVRYSVQAVTLSDISVVYETASWTASSSAVYIKVGSGEYAPATESSYTATETVTITVKAEGGMVSGDGNVYYAGEAVEKTATIVVPTTLETPVITADANGISWQAVANADGYAVSLDGGATYVPQTATTYAFATVAGSYTVLVKATSDNSAQFPDSVAGEYTYTVAAVSLSDISVVDATASWTAYGVVSLKEGKGEYAPYTESSYTATETIAISVKAEAGFVPGDTDVYYVGTEVEKGATIIVPITLETPVITADENGISWQAVTNADGYAVSVDGGNTFVPQTATTYAFATEAGNYSVLVKATSADSVQYPDSEPAQYDYSVEEISLSTIVIYGATASWTYGGVQYYKLAAGDEYQPYTETSYTNGSGESITVYLKITAGFDAENNVLYIGKDIEASAEIAYGKVAMPELSVKADGTGLIWTPSAYATKYQVKVNGGDWADATDYTFATTVDETYNVYVKGIGNGSTIDDSEVAEFVYTVKAVSLSDISVVDATASWKACGNVSLKEGSGEYAAYTESSYTATETVTIGVKAEGGMICGKTNVYYVGSAVEKTATVIVPITLSAPVITADGNGISWQAVTNADGYAVSVDGGATYLPQTATTYAFATVAGNYTVLVKATSEDSVQYPDSDAATFSYEVILTSAAVTVNGLTATWTATGMAAYLNDVACAMSGQTTVSSEIGSYTVKVSAEGGWDEANGIYYCGTAEDSKTITVAKLAAPAVSADANGIKWDAVTDATAYMVKLDDGSYATNGTTTTYAFATAAGNHTVSVYAVGNGTTALDGSAATYSYTTKAVSLTNLAMNNGTATWDATALMVQAAYGQDSGYQTLPVNSYTITVAGIYYIKAVGGWDGTNKIYYSGNDVKTSVTVTKLGKPTVTADANGIKWDAVTGATAYMVKVDSGAYATNGTSTTYSFSTTAGSHTVKVYAVGGGTVLNGDEATFTYTTKTTALSDISVSGGIASWTATAFSVDVKEGSGSYATVTGSSYAPSATCTITVRANGGWDSANSTYYNGTVTKTSGTITVSDLVIDTFENYTVGANSGTGWTIEKYDSGWVASASGKATVVKDCTATGKALKLDAWANGSSFRAIRSISLSKAYAGLELDIKLNDKTADGVQTKIRLQNAGGIYMTYDLANTGATSGSWYNVKISLDDDDWVITFGGKDYRLGDNRSTLNSAIGMTEYKTWEGALKSMNSIWVLIPAKSLDKGPQVYTYIDNVKLLKDEPTTGATEICKTVTALDFEDGAGSGTYTNSKWTQYTWNGSAYVTTSGKMNSRKPASSKITNFYCGYTTYKFIYNEGGTALGEANALTIDLGNWWISGKNIKYRIAIVDTDGNEIYLAGAKNTFAELAPTGSNTLTTLGFTFSKVNVKSIMVFARYDATSADNYLYCDNINLLNCSRL